MKFHDRALVLRRIPFQESSLVIHFFTRERGSQSLIARGIRSRKGPERATLAGFHTINIQGYCRSPQTLGTLLQTDIVHGRHRVREIPLAMAAAQVIQEMLYRHVPQGDAHTSLFDQVESALDQLDIGQNPLALLISMQGVTLRAIGYGWRTDACAGCGCEEALVYFSVRRAQTVCHACGLPYAKHLFSINAVERQAMTSLTLPNGLALLSPEEQLNLFRISSACFLRFGGYPIDSERYFRHLMGMEAQPNPPS
ncbi:MAG: DNA repair protein RecO [Magnetococcales bacterium]|nr:DNA repair protein RecO [Magnetococcales bacterium]